MSSAMVSVIVPVYNMEKFLGRCVESLLLQTYKHIEILLIDDGSQDGSMALCEKLSRLDDRIRVYYSSMYLGEANNKNNGLETTRNCGLQNATGDWIMFLDSDDTYVPNAIERMVRFAEINDADMVFASFNEIKDTDIIVPMAHMKETIYSQSEFAEYCFVDMPIKVMSCIGSKIYRRTLIENNSLRFDSYYRFNEDAAFMLSALMCANKIGYINFPFYNYMIRNTGSIQTSYREDMFEMIMRTYDLYKEFFEKNHVFESVKREYLRLITDIAYNSLFNDAKYARYNQFRQTFNYIKTNEHYAGMQAIFRHNGIGSKIMLVCMRFELPVVLYWILCNKK